MHFQHIRHLCRRGQTHGHNYHALISTLPPTTTNFESHCLRAHHQVASWKATGLPTTPDTSPLNFAWELLYGSALIPQHRLYVQPSASKGVLNLISCSCKSGCRSTMCSCANVALNCTQFCKCKAEVQCKNSRTVAIEDTVNDDE